MKLAIDTPVTVEWRDIFTEPAWTRSEDIHRRKPPLIELRGYYKGCKRVGKTVLWVYIAHNIDRADGSCDFTVIPFGPTVKIRRGE